MLCMYVMLCYVMYKGKGKGKGGGGGGGGGYPDTPEKGGVYT